eukprot:29207_1
MRAMKQRLREKMGKAEPTPEDASHEAICEAMRKFEEIKTQYTALHASAKKFQKALHNLTVAQREMCVALDTTADSNIAGESAPHMTAISRVVQSMADNLEIAQNEHTQRMFCPLDTMIVTELTEIKEIRKNYQHTKLKHDDAFHSVEAMKRKGKSGPALAEEERALQKNKDRLEDLRVQFAELLSKFENRRDRDLADSLVTYNVIWERFCQDCLSDM